MQDWWASLALFDKVVWAIALIVSLIFLIQTVMTFMGMESDVDADFNGEMEFEQDHGSPFQLFTFRNFVNFFLGFSWTIIAFRNVIDSVTILVFVGAVIGSLLVLAVMFLFYFMSKMQQSGNLKIQQAIGKTGEVYLAIPAHKNGLGKIHINLQGTLRELDAMTDGEALPSNSLVKVLSVEQDRILLVEKL